MATLQEIRQKYPGAYDDLSDEQLADKLYTRHYSDMLRSEFDAKVGLLKPPPELSPDGPPLFKQSFPDEARARGLRPEVLNGFPMGPRPQSPPVAATQAAGQYPAPEAPQAPEPAQGQENPFIGLSDDDARRFIAQLPEDQRDAALNSWADAFVARERANPSFGQSLDDTVRAIARGTPVGSWLDEASALGAAATGGSYDETVAYQRARDRAFDKEAPVVSTGLQIGGGVASGIGAVKAAPQIASGVARFSPWAARGITSAASAAPAATLTGRAIQGAKAGAVAGGVYGAGLGEGQDVRSSAGDRIAEAAKGVAIGGAIGSVAPLAASGLASLYSGAVQWARKPGGILAGYDKGAVERAASGIAQDQTTRASAAKTLRELGPEARLADIGPNVQLQTSGIARQLGTGRTIVTDALRARADGAEARLEAAVNNAVGRRINVPSFTKQLEAQSRLLYRPLYEQFSRTPVPLTPELEDMFGRLKDFGWPIEKAFDMARSQPGFKPAQFFVQKAQDGTFNITRVPNATEWDYIKRGLDKMAKSPDSVVRYNAANMARELRDSVDAAISPNDPKNSIYALARNLFAEKESIKEAIEAGKNAFTRNVSPDDLRAELAQMSAPDRKAFMFGARKYLEDVAGNAATKAGANPDTKIRAALNSNYAMEKIRLLAPKKQAEALIRRLRSESRFDAFDTRVLQNSVTAEAEAAKKALPQAPSTNEVRQSWRGLSIPGVIGEAVVGIHGALRGGVVAAKVDKSIADQARILMSQGYKAQQIVKALIEYNRGLGQSAANAAQIGRAVKAIFAGTRAPAQQGMDGRDVPVQRDANGRIVLDVYPAGDPRNGR